MEKSKIRISKNDIIKLSSNFYASQWSFVILIGISFIFSILQALLFGLGVIDVNAISSSSSRAWESWLSLGLSGLGSVLQFTGTVYLMRFNVRKNIMFTPIGLTLVILNVFLTGLIFTAIIFSIILIITIVRYFLWINSDNNKDKTKGNIKFWVFFIFVVTLFIVFGSLFYGFNIIQWKHKKDWLKYIDVINGALLIAGTMLLAMKSKWAFIMFLISGISSLIIFIEMNQIVTIITIALFKINDIVAFMAWSDKELQNT